MLVGGLVVGKWRRLFLGLRLFVIGRVVVIGASVQEAAPDIANARCAGIGSIPTREIRVEAGSERSQREIYGRVIVTNALYALSLAPPGAVASTCCFLRRGVDWGWLAKRESGWSVANGGLPASGEAIADYRCTSKDGLPGAIRAVR